MLYFNDSRNLGGNNMKRIISLFLTLVMVGSLAACGPKTPVSTGTETVQLVQRQAKMKDQRNRLKLLCSIQMVSFLPVPLAVG